MNSYPKNDRSHYPLGCPAPSEHQTPVREPLFAQIAIQESMGSIRRTGPGPFDYIIDPPHFNCTVNSNCDHPHMDHEMAREFIKFIRDRLDYWERNLDESLKDIWTHERQKISDK